VTPVLHSAAGHDRADPRKPDHPPAQTEEADYIHSKKSVNGSVSVTTVALTGHGRKAFDAYTKALRELLGGL